MHPVIFQIGSLVIPAYGALAATGVLVALALLLRTGPIAGVNPDQLWNLCILALLAALIGSRVLLIALNWGVVRAHPAWLLSLAMIHHPLVAGAGVLFAGAAAFLYALGRHVPIGNAADALASPVAAGIALEQIGSLMAGSGYGTPTDARWAVVYTHPLAARWSGAPLLVPVHPVQAYAALSFLLIAAALLLALPCRRQEGDIAGLCLMASGAAVYFTELWRDREGRGEIFGGAVDGPQIAAIGLVVAGALILRQRKDPRVDGAAGDQEAAHE